MRLDKYSNPIYNSQDIFNLLYQGRKECLTEIFVDANTEIKKFEHATNIILNDYPAEILSIEEVDLIRQQHWFMPDSYKLFDIKEFCLSKCTSIEQIERVEEEYKAFESHGLVTILQWLKYFVDTCNENNVLWGVGRGSSVSSYILYLLEVHLVDSLKYNLDWREFLR